MTVEELQVLMTANTDSLRKEINNVQKQVTGLQKVANNTSKSMLKSFNFLKNGIIALGIGKIIGSQMDDAISRLDALNNFPRVMSNLGVSSEDAQASMNRLSNALIGLPTTLDDAALSVQRFTSANGNVKASTEMFLALNNAILAGGASSQAQKTALEQLSQAYAKGKPDMMEWRSAMTAMPAQLKQVAISMGYVSADQLGEALRNGTVSMNEFMVEITKLNKNGLNGFRSFEEQARNSTGGVATSITNLKTAFTRGLADIMNAIGQSNISGFFNGIAKVINMVIPYITGFVKACVWAVSAVTSLFGGSTKKQVDSVSESMSSLGSSGVSVADGFDDATDSAKALNKELKGLAGFDEMNVLKDSSSSSSGSGNSTGGGGSFDLSGIDLSAFDSGLGDVASKADEIAEKLKSVFTEIAQIMADIWNSEPVQAFVDTAVTYGQFLWDFWSTIGNDLLTNITMTWSNISTNVGTYLNNMSTLWTLFWTDINNGIKTWGQPIINGVSGIFNSIWHDAIDPVLVNISQVWADFSQILVDTWGEKGETLINNIGEFVTKTIQLFQDIWDKVINPIIKPFLEMLSWLWDKHLKDMVTELIGLVTDVVNCALEIYNKFIQPIISWLIDKLAPAWSVMCSFVINYMGTLFAFISDIITNIIQIFRGIIEFVNGVFTGDWKKAWNGVKKVFKGIFESLGDIVKGVFNVIIDALNFVIDALNHISIKIPNWVPFYGGKKWGFNLKKIDKLGTGGVVDKPMIAEIGEAGREVVMPLERNTGWITELAQELRDRGSDNSQPIQLVFKLGEDTLFDKIIKGLRDKEFESNGEVFAI